MAAVASDTPSPPANLAGSMNTGHLSADGSLEDRRGTRAARLRKKTQFCSTYSSAEPYDPQSGSSGPDGWPRSVCRYFASGCCWYGKACYFRHDGSPPDSGYKTALCEQFTQTGQCPKDDCFFAHGQDELRTPPAFRGVPGYKRVLCTYHLLAELECQEESCFDAHGPLDLRRLRPSLPPSLRGAAFLYSDAHLHLDEVLLSRRYGSCWYYKSKHCWTHAYRNDRCALAHGTADLRPRLPIDIGDLSALAAEFEALTGATFAGCVHSCCEASTIEESIRLVQWGREVLHGRVYVSFGIHPSEFEQYTPEVEAQLEAAVEACGSQAVAWGECGLDYYHRGRDLPGSREQMHEAFARQARVAVRRGLPLVVHCRDAVEDALMILQGEVPAQHPVCFHSFMGSVELIPRLLDAYPRSCISVNGCLTYDWSGHLHGIARAVPLGRMLLETDGPYMAPGCHRGEEAHPGHIPLVAEAVAQAKGLETLEVLAVAHENFRRFYRL